MCSLGLRTCGTLEQVETLMEVDQTKHLPGLLGGEQREQVVVLQTSIRFTIPQVGACWSLRSSSRRSQESMSPEFTLNPGGSDLGGSASEGLSRLTGLSRFSGRSFTQARLGLLWRNVATMCDW